MKSKIFLNICLFLTLQLLSVFTSGKLFGQEYNYDDFEIKNRRYGFGVGFNPFLIQHDFNDLNSKLKFSGNKELSGKNLFTLGGAFYIYTGFLPDFRIGGYWSEGSKESSSTESVITREFEYNYNFWGISFDYAYPAAKRLSLVGGIMLGKGTQEYVFSNRIHNSISWEDVWLDEKFFPTTVSDKKTTLNSQFFVYSPFVMVEYAIWDFLAIRAGAGYMGSVKTDLNYEDFYSVSGAPNSIRINNFYFQFGILTGLFMD